MVIGKCHKDDDCEAKEAKMYIVCMTHDTYMSFACTYNPCVSFNLNQN